MSFRFDSEEALAAVVVNFYRARGWTVAQEYSPRGYSELGVLDVLAERSGEFWAISCKTSLGFAVVAQAVRWHGYVHRTWVAIPAVEDTESIGWQYARATVRRDDVGILIVTPNTVTELEVPRRVSEPRAIGLEILPEHETFAKAGTSSGRYFTKQQAIQDELVAAVISRPNRRISKYMDEIKVNGVARMQLERWAKKTPRLRAEKKSGLWFISGPEESE